MSVRQDTINLQVNINGNESQNKLNELRNRAGQLATEMKGLKKNTDDYINKGKELSTVTGEMDKLKKQIGITALSQKELVAELRKLNALKGSVVPFSEEFKSLQKEINGVEKRLYDVRNGVQGFQSVMSKVGDGVKQFGILAAGYLGFQFLTSQFQNIIKGAGKLSDQLADLRRVTGLTADEANTLNSSLKGIDTRTSAQGLRDIAIIAGKLGVAKEDILGFTEAVDKLVVTLGDELGNADQITTSLGKILNVFDGKVDGDNITKLGNAFVELANAGVATGGFLADFDQRLSGLAKGVGISLGELTGLGAGIENLGGKVESSSTAIQKLLINISNDLPKAAKIAGKSTDEFRNLFNTNAVEALLQYSEGLVKNKNAFSDITAEFKNAGEEGTRTIETLLKLGKSADIVRVSVKQGADSIKETGGINDGFALKNENLGASLDKLGKKFNALVNSKFVTGFLTGLIDGFSKLIGLFEDGASKLDEYNKELSNFKKLDTEITPLLARIDELTAKTVRSKEEQIELSKAVLAVSSSIPSAITQFDAYGRAIGVNTEKAREFINLQRAVLQEKNRDAISEQTKLQASLTQEYNATARQLTVNKARLDAYTDAMVKTEKQMGSVDKAGRKTFVVLENIVTSTANKMQLIRQRLQGIGGIIKELDGSQVADAINNFKPPPVVDPFKPTPTGDKKADKEAAARAKREKEDYDRLKAEAEKFYKDIQKLKDKTAAGDDAQQKEIQAAVQKYKDLLEKAKEYYVKHAIDQKRFGEEEQIITEAQKQALQEIFDKYYKKNFEEGSKKEYEESLNNLQNFFDEQRLITAKAYAAGVLNKKEYEEKIKELERQETESRIVIATDYKDTVKEAGNDLVKENKKNQQQQTKDLVEETDKRKKLTVDEELAQARLKILLSRPGSNGELEAKKALLQKQFALDTEEADKESALYLEKKKQLNDALGALDDEYFLERVRKVEAYAQYFVQALSSVNTILANGENRAFNKEKALNDKRKNEFKKQLDGKLISQAQYDKKVAELQEQQDAREREIKRKQAKREKAVNLLSAVVNTASAVVEALPNIPLSIIVGALGLLQIGAIASAPLPELGRGGMLHNGPSHSDSDKGLHVVNPRTGRTEMLVEREEAVLNKKAMRSGRFMNLSGTPRQIASALNTEFGGVSFGGGARSIGAGPSINSNMPRIMAAGGIIAGQEEAFAQQSNELQLAQLAETRGMREDLQNFNTNLKAHVVYKEITNKGQRLEEARRAGNISQ